VSTLSEFKAWAGELGGGIYALSFRGDLAYIGKTSSFPRRIWQHQEAGMQFDFVRVIEESSEANRRKLERALIHKYSPPCNGKRFRGDTAIITVRLGELAPLVAKWMKKHPGVPVSNLLRQALELALRNYFGDEEFERLLAENRPTTHPA
jgi:hypothetical protein